METQVKFSDAKTKSKKAFNHLGNNFFHLYLNAPIGYFTLNIRNTITMVNFAGCDLLNSEGLYLNKVNFTKYIAPESLDDFSNFMKQIRHANSDKSIKLKMVRESGEKFSAKLQCSTLKHGNINYCLCAATDIS